MSNSIFGGNTYQLKPRDLDHLPKGPVASLAANPLLGDP
jgi:hypothetical protein